jgi:hypothetical protein
MRARHPSTRLLILSGFSGGNVPCMVQIDIALAASIGATLAVAARSQLKSEPQLWKNGYLAATVAFNAFFLAPVVVWFLVQWPAWDSMYWWDRETLPTVLPSLVAVAVLLTSSAGFVATHAALRAGRERMALALPVIFLAPALIVLGVFHDRVLHVGTRATYAAGAPVNVMSSDLLWGQLVVIPVLVLIPLVALGWRWLRPELQARRAAPATSN